MPEVEHVLLEAMLESRGHRHEHQPKHRYRNDALMVEDVTPIYQSITPIFELSNTLLKERGYKPEEVMAELAEEEAGRMKNIAKTMDSLAYGIN